MSHVGPMARDVADLALLFAIIRGPDGRDTTIHPGADAPIDAVEINGLRCGFMLDNGSTTPDDETQRVLFEVRDLLERLGVVVSDVCFAEVGAASELVRDLLATGGYAFVLEAIQAAGTRRDDISIDWLRPLHPDTSSPEAYHAWRNHFFGGSTQRRNDVLNRLEAVRSQLLRQMSAFDVLLTPVNPASAPRLPPPGAAPFDDGSYTELYDLTGWPAGVVRAGTGRDGLPIGAQIVANPGREDLVLLAMSAIERELGGFPAPPLP